MSQASITRCRGDQQRAVEIVENDGSYLLEQSQMATLIGLVGKLPAATVQSHPRLQLALAWANIMLHRSSRANRLWHWSIRHSTTAD